MNNNVEKIKDRLNIVDVVGSYIKLEKAGSNLRACCPFHNEKTPSFFVSPVRGTYKCFGCGEGGDIFSFVEKFEGVDFKGSLKILAEQAGIKLEKENPKVADERKRIYSVLEETTLYFENNIKNNKLALEYLKNRGITQQTIERFRLGFAEDGWQNLYDFLKEKDYTDVEIEKAGLIKKNEQGSRFYDRFRNRIIFPLFDNSGQPIAFSGRFFGKDDKEGIVTAKYLNSPETLLFNKSGILYGYNFAKLKIRKRDFSILVEGQMDLLMCHQTGYDNAVASSGTALSQGHIRLLKRLSNRVVVAFDGDEAGFSSACRATKIALAEGMEVRLLNIPDGLDPADFILKDKQNWQKELKEAKHIIDFYLNKLTTEIKGTSNQTTTNGARRKLGKAVQEKVLPFVAILNSEIEKASFVKEISDKLSVPDKVIWAELDKISKNSLVSPQQRDSFGGGKLAEKLAMKSKKNRKQIILRQISGMYWWQKGVENPVFDIQEFEKEIKDIIGDEVFEKIENLNNEIKDEIIFEVEILYEEVENIEEKVKELFNNLRIELIDEKIKDIMIEQKEAESKGDAKDVLGKLKIFDKLSKEKSKLIK